MSEHAAHVRCSRRGALGRLTLNRPERLNALSLPMIQTIARQLRTWDADPTIEAVLLDGAGERGFCAGGDLTVVHRSATAGEGEAATLWREEYALDLQLAQFGKPLVAFMNGLVMGGGLGLTVHAEIRVVTETSTLAMPEVGIGLAPDVGAGDFLGRIPGHVGTHLALTGARIGPNEAIALGLADVQVATEQLPALAEALATASDVHRAAAKYARRQVPWRSWWHAVDWIAACYDSEDPREIVARLSEHPAGGARQAAMKIAEASPTAVSVARCKPSRKHGGSPAWLPAWSGTTGCADASCAIPIWPPAPARSSRSPGLPGGDLADSPTSTRAMSRSSSNPCPRPRSSPWLQGSTARTCSADCVKPDGSRLSDGRR